MQRAISFKDATMVYVNGNHYRTHFWYISKYEALTSQEMFLSLKKAEV